MPSGVKECFEPACPVIRGRSPSLLPYLQCHQQRSFCIATLEHLDDACEAKGVGVRADGMKWSVEQSSLGATAHGRAASDSRAGSVGK